MKQNEFEKAKAKFLKILPKKLQETLQAYHLFTSVKVPEDIKSFAAYHTACKNALSHMVLLMKMIQLSDSNNANNLVDDWLEKSKLAISQLEEEEDE
ncbi:MAG: hypothetical protein E7013_00840 [Alphaproteobacteria bacterium]|nr:hypothetical protein [Alphaproteobacteria bacterium]